MSSIQVETSHHRALQWVRPVALRSIIGAMVVAAIVGIITAISGHFSSVTGQAFFTVALFVVYALLSWYDADVSSKRAAWFGALSLGVTIYLLVIGIIKIWFPYVTHQPNGFFGEYEDGTAHRDFFGEFWAWIWLALVARVALLHIHLLLFIYRKYSGGIMQRIAQVTFVLVGVLGVMLSIPSIARGVHFPDIYWRSIAVVAILDALGTVLVPLVYSLFHRPPKVPTGMPAPQYAAPAPVAPTSAPLPNAAPKLPVPTDLPPAEAYAEWVPNQAPLKLKWPQYEDGRPLPRNPDGTPDFTGVIGY